MFDFSTWIDLPLIWACLLAIAVLLYVLLDGFDLGVGILFPFAPSEKCRDRMMNSVAPFWDGNETWLVLGGGGLFAAFPLAYSILMPAFYLPIILMLIGLIFRGVAFEFRFKANHGRAKYLWDYSFHFGSLLAAFMQGAILGGFVQGLTIEGRTYAGGAFDWLNSFSVMTGLGVIWGYALLGSTWLVMKTEDETQAWARRVANYVLWFVGLFMALVSLLMPMINADIRSFWFSTPNIFWLLPIPILTIIAFAYIWITLHRGKEIVPFLLSIALFIFGYLGLAVSLWPWMIPFQLTLWDVAAIGPSQSLLLVGTVILLPIILAYTAYCYYIFRGKADHEKMY